MDSGHYLQSNWICHSLWNTILLIRSPQEGCGAFRLKPWPYFCCTVLLHQALFPKNSQACGPLHEPLCSPSAVLTEKVSVRSCTIRNSVLVLFRSAASCASSAFRLTHSHSSLQQLCFTCRSRRRYCSSAACCCSSDVVWSQAIFALRRSSTICHVRSRIQRSLKVPLRRSMAFLALAATMVWRHFQCASRS